MKKMGHRMVHNPSICWEVGQTSPTMRTASGLYVDLLNPKPESINIGDIAHSLANQCRWTGHTKEFFSVAQHSILVSRLCPTDLKLAGLLHDAAEAYTCDISSPLKAVLGGEASKYKQVQHQITKVIFSRYGLQSLPDPRIKIADLGAAAIESHQLMGKLVAGLKVPYGFEGLELVPLSPSSAKAEFLWTFASLVGAA